MNDWIEQAATLDNDDQAAVLVTVAGLRGSAPRETGAKMLVTRGDTRGTIGGGELEYQCTRIAARMLTDDSQGFLRRFPLGSRCGQCCGGVVDILFEPLSGIAILEPLVAAWRARTPSVLLTVLDGDERPQKILFPRDDEAPAAHAPTDEQLQAVRELMQGSEMTRRLDTPGRGETFGLVEAIREPDFNIAVFGAGHVGSAVTQLFAGLDCSLRWIDTRRGIFPPQLPAGVQAIETAEPLNEVAAMPAATWYLVMTHSHALDLGIVAAILRRGDAACCGLIGSQSKRRRFEGRLRQQGISDSQQSPLVCPIGISGISGKSPQEIAIATAADILRRREQQVRQTAMPRQGLQLVCP